MIKKYGESSKVNLYIKNKIQSLEKNLKDLNDVFYLYFGYPCKNAIGKKSVLKLLLVCKKGIFNFFEDGDSKDIFREFVSQKILKISSIADKIDDGVTIVKHININSKFNIDEYSDVLTEEELNQFNALFQNSISLRKEDNREIKNKTSLGNLIKTRNQKINTYDENQFNAIYTSYLNHNVRIRGLAGSGKTIIMVKKMAYLYFQNPELRMAYVFYTVSLKQYIQQLFIKFYRDFEPFKDIDFEKIKFLHGWGSRNYSGFYSTICEEKSIEKESYKNIFGDTNSFSDVCNNLITKLDNERLGMYDYVFIDEAQDFPLSFFALARKSLNANGKIVYAYDELQTLFSTSNIPSKKDIFGEDYCEDIDLKICYRTPKEILITAHALGMGIYQENSAKKLCNIPEDLSIWDAIGYEHSTPMKYGGQVSLFRSPSQIDFSFENSIEFKMFSDREEQYISIIKDIYHLIRNEDVAPDDILIIDLDSLQLNDNFTLFKEKTVSFLNQAFQGRERLFELNLINKDNVYDFKISNAIPYTTIFRAKGNEANIVFVLNADKMNSLTSYSRNRLFTAMTRAKFKVVISGLEKIEQYINEFNKVKEHNFKLEFTYPTKEELKHLKTMALKEEKNAIDMSRAIDTGKGLRESNPEAFIELLLEQTGCKTIEELNDFIDGFREKNGKR